MQTVTKRGASLMVVTERSASTPIFKKDGKDDSELQARLSHFDSWESGEVANPGNHFQVY